MAKRTPSAVKKHRQSLKRRERNKSTITLLRTLSKKANAAIESGDPAKSEEALRNLESALDKAASKGIIHKRNASRHVARYSKKVHNISKQKEAEQKPAEETTQPAG
ncbi:MAG TPA: 30S ribosomal protein S20 [Thermodesulfobacteriota bacterium]|nr:30S ribosomal protein S20 [Thermodesulfobacteriota bacterium]